LRAPLLALLAIGGCAVPADSFYDAAQIDDPAVGRCGWTRKYQPPIVYQESDHIRGYFEATDLTAYRKAIAAPFALPPRPLVRVTVLDFYEMANGPTYREAEVSILVLHRGEPGWFTLTMPVTDEDACGGGRSALGTPKVMRRVTLASGGGHFVGTVYALGGRAADFALTLDEAEADEQTRELLRSLSSFPDLLIRERRILTYDKPARESVTVRPGRAGLESAPESLPARLGVGKAVAGYWARVRQRFSITPRYVD